MKGIKTRTTTGGEVRYRGRIYRKGRTYLTAWVSTEAKALVLLEEIKLDLIMAERQGVEFVTPKQAAQREKHEAKKQSITLEQWSEKWLATYERPNTIRAYNSRMRAKVYPVLGKIRLSEITHTHIRNFMKSLDGSPGYKASIGRTLAACFNAAIKEELITKTPITTADYPKPKARGLEAVATPKQVHQLAEYLKPTPTRSVDLSLMVYLAAWCQLRLGEVLALRRCDIVKDKNRVYWVSVTRSWVPKARVFGEPKTRAGVRKIVAPASLTPIIDQHLEKLDSKNPSALLFPSLTDKSVPFSDTGFRLLWDKARIAVYKMDKKHRVSSPLSPSFHFHDLRHTGLTHYAQQGATVAELLHRGGHVSVEVALKYQHALEERDLSLTRKLDELVIV